jgi:hypothetical protein
MGRLLIALVETGGKDGLLGRLKQIESFDSVSGRIPIVTDSDGTYFGYGLAPVSIVSVRSALRNGR